MTGLRTAFLPHMSLVLQIMQTGETVYVFFMSMYIVLERQTQDAINIKIF